MRLTLRQIEVFLAVARDESASRAAAQLAMSQSAVSGALADLERQFDIQLFDRVGKRLRLSSLGHAIRDRSEALLEAARDLEAALQARSGAERLRIGATVTIGDYLAAPLMARFMELHPHARLSLEVANTAAIARRLANFELDVGLIEGEIHHADLEVVPWRQDALVVFCAPHHALARRRTLRDADLREANWVVREAGSGTRQAFEHAMQGLLPQLRIVLELQQIEAIKLAVARGMGLGCLSRMALDAAFERGELIACRVPHRDLRRTLYLALHKRKFRSEGVQRWLELCMAPVTSAIS